MFVPQNPEDIKIILNSDECYDKPVMFYEKIVKHGLMSLNGEAHKHQRKALNPAFFPGVLKSFLPVLSSKVDKFLKSFDESLSSEPFDLFHHTMEFTLESTLATLFGNEGMNKEERSEFVCTVDKQVLLDFQFIALFS